MDTYLKRRSPQAEQVVLQHHLNELKHFTLGHADSRPGSCRLLLQRFHDVVRAKQLLQQGPQFHKVIVFVIFAGLHQQLRLVQQVQPTVVQQVRLVKAHSLAHVLMQA